MAYCVMRKRPEEYRLVIFDLDGTLYFQRPLRLAMAARLACFYLLHPWRMRELLVLRNYRRIRENAGVLEVDAEEKQYEEAGRSCGLSAAAARAVILHWMYEVPCRILKRFRDGEVRTLMERLQEQGVLTVVYSDYPVSEKLAALEMKVPLQFCAADPQIRCLKPDPRGILAILEQCGVAKQEVVMIGDRMEKDGEAAVRAGIDYCILSSRPSKRKKQFIEGDLHWSQRT